MASFGRSLNPDFGFWGKGEEPLRRDQDDSDMRRGEVSKRPWGQFTTYVTNQSDVTVKVIVVNPRHRLSMQYHAERSERWICLLGEAIAEINGKKRTLRPNQEALVPVGAKHRLGAGPKGAMVLEIAEGRFSEDDIVRLEDDYRRE